ncbi:MAG: tetratricopeptide repeat protein [Deltaproteobacteria bacterium]|nr:tetratricopeptide repeat protein [Deltaproteobacteria bacterium]
MLDRATASISRYLALRPESGRGYFLKAEHARLTAPEGRRSSTARQAYERAVELAPDDPDAVRELGLLYYGDGEVARATVLLQKYLSLVPDAADRNLIQRYLDGRGSTE